MNELGPSRRELPMHYGVDAGKRTTRIGARVIAGRDGNGRDLGTPNRPVAAIVHLGHASRHEAPD
jgi:hypothetical protein